MLHILLLVLTFCLNVAASTSFPDCYNRLLNGEFGLDGAVDSYGKLVTNLSQAVGLTYEACKANCGLGSEAIKWVKFSSQFTAWLLPWLALISQLPFGANDGPSNLETMLLTVGSPMLAAYSLTLSVTSNRWMLKQFRHTTDRNSFYAARILNSLQQVSFSITEQHILPSLVVLMENGAWWRKLDENLDYSSSRWTLAAIVSMGYVVLGYIFSWIDSVRGLDVVMGGGQHISSFWMCLLPIVICYLQLSPKSDLEKIRKVVESANKSFFVVTETGEVEQTTSSRAIIVKTASHDMEDEDQICPTPICFYARVFSWIKTARTVTDAYDAFSHYKHTSQQERNSNVIMTREEVIKSCKLDGDRSDGYDVFLVFMISALLAILLQWGTTGAGIMAIYMTPTRGLGCRSASGLIYGILATIVWILMVISSVLACSYRTCRKSKKLKKVTGALVVFFRQAGKVIAAINACWILMSSLSQFINVFDNCFCDSNVLGLGSQAYVVLYQTPEIRKHTLLYWINGAIMASGTTLVFIVAINLLLKRPEHRSLVE